MSNIAHPADPRRAQRYRHSVMIPAKHLRHDGSITEPNKAGSMALPPDAVRAARWENSADTPIRYLYSDGSVWDGVPGSDEADGGMGGTVRWFVDITERDTYFTENPGQLREGISVGAGDPVTAFTFDGTQWLLGALAFKGEKGDPGDGISDSPLDGTLYGRKDGDWTEVDATSILFADGETLQDKLNRGALGGAEWEDF